jgi:hypothetical protein
MPPSPSGVSRKKSLSNEADFNTEYKLPKNLKGAQAAAAAVAMTNAAQAQETKMKATAEAAAADPNTAPTLLNAAAFTANIQKAVQKAKDDNPTDPAMKNFDVAAKMAEVQKEITASLKVEVLKPAKKDDATKPPAAPASSAAAVGISSGIAVAMATLLF